MIGLLFRLWRWRRTARTIDALLAGDVETLLRRKMVGRFVWLPLYRRIVRRPVELRKGGLNG